MIHSEKIEIEKIFISKIRCNSCILDLFWKTLYYKYLNIAENTEKLVFVSKETALDVINKIFACV